MHRTPMAPTGAATTMPMTTIRANSSACDPMGSASQECDTGTGAVAPMPVSSPQQRPSAGRPSLATGG